MILIADSGSTKTDWKIVADDQAVIGIQTIGFNPVLTTTDSIFKELSISFTEKERNESIVEVHYYGAGCWDHKSCLVVHNALIQLFPNARIEVTNDLLGAARSVCGHQAGIACILGTGANSCLYDGQKIVDNVPALGFIVGDEGSGAYLGKQLLRHYFYRNLPKDLQKKLLETHDVSKKIMLKKVYQNPRGNRYLASFVPFLVQEKKHPYVQKLVETAFEAFINNQVTKYKDAPHLPIHFVGSIAHFFKDFLQKKLFDHQLKLGEIIRQPIDGLVEFHKLG